MVSLVGCGFRRPVDHIGNFIIEKQDLFSFSRGRCGESAGQKFYCCSAAAEFKRRFQRRLSTLFARRRINQRPYVFAFTRSSPLIDHSKICWPRSRSEEGRRRDTRGTTAHGLVPKTRGADDGHVRGGRRSD